LRSRFGQSWQHINAVEDNRHSPQCLQRNTGTLTTSSKKRTKRENFLSLAVMGGVLIETKFFDNGVSLHLTLKNILLG
jgi:hypothetical protein